MSVHDETPAETIRRAIEQMRGYVDLLDPDGIWDPASALATADLLEAIEDEIDLTPIERAALRLARTYLGETP